MEIGIALLGAGIFATEQHLPAIQACPDLCLKAIYSRSQRSAQTLAKIARGDGDAVDVYYDSTSADENSVDALLQRQDIDAVVIAVSIFAAPDLIRKALVAGKNVLSEKPIAPNVETAQSLLDHYRTVTRIKPVIWAVGENFRFWNSVTRAAEILDKLDANLVAFNVSIFHFIGLDNKYLASDWRKNPTHQGGFILDGGVHFTAILRFLLASVREHITTVSAFTSLIQPRLGPIDTIHAILQTEHGKNGTFTISNGSEFKAGFEVEVVTDRGSVLLRPTQVITKLKDEGGAFVENKEDLEMDFGVKREMKAFTEGLKQAKLDPRITAQEALKDLELLEAMFKSAEAGGNVMAVSY